MSCAEGADKGSGAQTSEECGVGAGAMSGRRLTRAAGVEAADEEFELVADGHGARNLRFRIYDFCGADRTGGSEFYGFDAAGFHPGITNNSI